MNEFAEAVLAWFDRHGRHDLPWQQDVTPYRVWVSEIMLQQTQVATVIPYYQAFMARFPDVEALATADIDSVLQHWAGLGYYARGRNLHRAAGQVVAAGGKFPDTLEGLMALPGIGRSTAGAVLALGHGRRGVILDGNVRRVLMRCFAIPGDPQAAPAQQRLWQLASELTPDRRCGDYAQAMMDLGATLCTRARPLCLYCPLRGRCQALALGEPTAFPQARARKSIPVRQAFFVLLHRGDGAVLWQRRPPSGIWGGLWCLPQIDGETEQALCAGLRLRFGVDTEPAGWERLPALDHVFSHFRLQLLPVRVPAPASMPADPAEGTEMCWLTPAEASTRLGLPAPLSRLVASLG